MVQNSQPLSPGATKRFLTLSGGDEGAVGHVVHTDTSVSRKEHWRGRARFPSARIANIAPWTSLSGSLVFLLVDFVVFTKSKQFRLNYIIGHLSATVG